MRVIKVLFVAAVAVLWTVNIYAAETALTSDNYEHTAPVWSPDGLWIAYEKVDATGFKQIYKIDPSGGPEIQLTSSADTHQALQWSPDSSTIVCFHGGPSTTPGIHTVPVGGGPETQLTNDSTDGGPVYSPDGTKIGFSRMVGIYFQIFTIPSGGGAVTQLTFDSFHHGLTDWSPDGTELLYRKIDGTGFYQIYKMPSGGGAEVPLTSESSNTNGPNFSNNGSKIVYRLNGQLYTMNTDGSGNTQITSGSVGYTGVNRWSPDDNYIVSYSSTVTGFFQIWVLRSVGGGETMQTSDSYNHYLPYWAPDQSKIAYHKLDGTGFRQIYTLTPVLPPLIPITSNEVLIIFFAGVIIIVLLTSKRRSKWARKVFS